MSDCLADEEFKSGKVCAAACSMFSARRTASLLAAS
jgi:hypothetical protein